MKEIRFLLAKVRVVCKSGLPIVVLLLNVTGCVVPQHAGPGEDCIRAAEKERVENYDTAFYHSVSAIFTSANPQPWCRTYKADKDKVSKVVMTIMPRLGNPIKTADVANGIFLTDEIERSHSTARWKDSYSITVSASGTGEATVRVLRLLHLYVVGGARRMKPAETDGHNEKWFLTQVGDALAK